jgi:hypothetical protein
MEFVLVSRTILAEENKERAQKKQEAIPPELREFIDRAIVPILVQEYLKELRQHPVSAPSDEKPDSKPKTGNSWPIWVHSAMRCDSSNGHQHARTAGFDLVGAGWWSGGL